MDPLEEDITALFTRLGKTVAMPRRKWWHVFLRKEHVPTAYVRAAALERVPVRKLRPIEDYWMPQETKVDLQPVRSVLRSEAAAIRGRLDDALNQDASAFDLQTKLLLQWQAVIRGIDVLDGRCDVNGQTLRPESGMTKAFNSDTEAFRPKGRATSMPEVAQLEQQPDTGKANLRGSA